MTTHLLVIGAQRCGTTWLHDQLAAHPQIAMARPARPEPKVFLRGPSRIAPEGSAGPGLCDAEAYHAEFFTHATGERVLGEKSTSYLESPHVPDRVAATLGSPKVIVQLRDPVQRAVSNWKFSRDHGVEEHGLAEALRTDLSAPRGWDRGTTSVSPFAYLSRGRYADALAAWMPRFEVWVQFLEEVRIEPKRIAALYRWLGVDDDVQPELHDRPVNAAHPSGAELGETIIEELRDYYADSDAALSVLLGRSLPWPTGRPL